MDKEIMRKRIRFDLSHEKDKAIWNNIEDFDVKSYNCVSDYIIDIMHKQLFETNNDNIIDHSINDVVDTYPKEVVVQNPIDSKMLSEIMSMLGQLQEENRYLHNENRKLLEKIIDITNEKMFAPLPNQENNSLKEEVVQIKEEEKDKETLENMYDFSNFDEGMFKDLDLD